MNFASYDIEIVEDLRLDEVDERGEKKDPDLREYTPSVAAYCTTVDDTKFFWDEPYMTKETGKKLVNELMDKYREGFLPFGWNTLSFDFQLLAHYTGMYEECGILALNGVDAMFIMVSKKGYYKSLNTALEGANIEAKVKSVRLNDGSILDDMSGAKAPLLWRQGEYNAVKEYLLGDVVQPLKLAHHYVSESKMTWFAKSGRRQSVLFKDGKLLTVKECLELDEPDMSWMDKPKFRFQYYNWIPVEVLHKENVIKKQEDEFPF